MPVQPNHNIIPEIWTFCQGMWASWTYSGEVGRLQEHMQALSRHRLHGGNTSFSAHVLLSQFSITHVRRENPECYLKMRVLSFTSLFAKAVLDPFAEYKSRNGITELSTKMISLLVLLQQVVALTCTYVRSENLAMGYLMKAVPISCFGLVSFPHRHWKISIRPKSHWKPFAPIWNYPVNLYVYPCNILRFYMLCGLHGNS